MVQSFIRMKQIESQNEISRYGLFMKCGRFFLSKIYNFGFPNFYILKAHTNAIPMHSLQYAFGHNQLNKMFDDIVAFFD